VGEKKIMKCQKCGEKLAEVTADVFGNIFGCTRDPKNLDALHGETIQSYYCTNCGYLEFYKVREG
jgi:DNA-directed RNA polymerase subunit RPC12/RpoP